MIDTTRIRQYFPILSRQISNRPIIYLDSAATYLKPQPVIDAVCDCYQQASGTVGRGVHVLAEEASIRFAEAREAIAEFINADAEEIVFVRNATEAINLVASSLPEGMTVLGSDNEHHSNLLPWRDRHRYYNLPVDESGWIDVNASASLAESVRPKLFALSTIGNAFGNLTPVDAITELARSIDSDVLLDVNQSIAHEPIDVRKLDCEYACFSGHKLGGPTGLGVLYAKRDRLELLQPRLLGGGMVDSVSATGHVLAKPPMRLEAGTVSFEAVIGLAAACEFLAEIDLQEIHQHEQQLTVQLQEGLLEVPRITIRGPQQGMKRGTIVAFQVEGLEAHGVARMLSNRNNLCVRSGFHCAEQAHESHGWRPTIRASFGVYNTIDEVNVLIDALGQITRNMGL